MTDFMEMAIGVRNRLIDASVPDEEILSTLRENSELAGVIFPSTDNLFIKAVMQNRFEVAKELANMGADIHIRCKPSLIRGNALNVAHSPEMADYLLGLGLEVERNLSMREDFVNPALMAVGYNDSKMLFYWLKKQKELFSEEEGYLRELIRAVIEWAGIMNQSSMLAAVMADEELYCCLKELYRNKDSEESVRLSLCALRQIKEKALEDKKKELRTILNERKKEILA